MRQPTTTDGQCRCGCGQTTGIVKASRPALGIVKGQHAAYIPGHGLRKGPEYIVDPITQCWVWNRRRSPKGYGMMRNDDGKPGHLAHRVFYERANGTIPPGLVLDHLCRNRACVNPDHLEPVSNRENSVMRGTDHNANKTHCPHGHPFDEANTRYAQRPTGVARLCRACLAIKRRERYLREGR